MYFAARNDVIPIQNEESYRIKSYQHKGLTGMVNLLEHFGVRRQGPSGSSSSPVTLFAGSRTPLAGVLPTATGEPVRR